MKFVLKCSTLLAIVFSSNAADDWTQVFPPDPHPSARYAHAMAYIGEDQVLMFAGNTGIYNGETWLYDLGDNTWTNLDPSGDVPEARRDHGMAYIEDGQVLLFGGYVESNYWVNDTWLYTLGTNSWTLILPSSSSPDERYSHAMCYIGEDQVLVYGGFGGVWLSDTWIFDLSDNTWTEVSPSGGNPGGRQYHDVARIGNGQVLLFGGWLDGIGWDNETWLYDQAINTWTNMFPTGEIPSERYYHAMAYVGDDCVITYGGEDQWGGFGDTRVYDLSENTWTIEYNTVAPGGRWRHKMSETSLDASSYIVMFGGHLYGLTDDETWTFGGGDYLGVNAPTGQLDIPEGFGLHANYPNPLNPTTTISFELREANYVELDVFDINGRRVGVSLALTRQYLPGHHQITFDGAGLTSGIYIYRLTAGDFTASGKMVMMK